MTPSHRSLLASMCALFLAEIGPVAHAQNPIPPSPPSLAPRTSTSRYHDLAASPTPGASPAAAATPATAAAPTGASPGAGTSGPAVAASNDYVLAPSDAVEMTIFHEPDLATQTRIGGDGTVQFPLIGEVRVGGMTVRDAREMIRRRYNADYLVEPQVYLNVLTYAVRRFTVLGQVAKPGAYDFPGGEHLTLLEAVGMAGGFTRLADQSSVTVRRTAPGKPEQSLKVNAKKLNDRGAKTFELAPGDVVTVGESWF